MAMVSILAILSVVYSRQLRLISQNIYFAEPVTIKRDTVYLIGTWDIYNHYAQTAELVGTKLLGSNRVNYFYSGKSVSIVAASTQEPALVEVSLDSKPLDESIAGSDIIFERGGSFVKIAESRVYNIISAESEAKHLLELVISNPGVRVGEFEVW